MHRRLVGAVLVGVALVAACGSDDDGGAGDAARPIPEVTDVYAVPDPLPDGQPGDVIQIEPLGTGTVTNPGATAWRVLYRSESVSGEPIAVSGLIARPAGEPPEGGFPVLAWAHGTTGTADSCAPSLNPGLALGFVASALDAGFVVAATDYEGLGTPGLHPYLVGPSEARGVLDAARAATRIEEVDASDRVVVWGHSQGGHAALFAGEVAPSYAAELDVAGVVAMAPAADLAVIASAALSSPALFGFGFMALGTWPTAYPGFDLSTLLTPAALERLPLLDEVCSTELFGAFGDQALTDLLATASPLDLPALQNLLVANSVGARPYGPTPVLVVHGRQDALIPYALSEGLVPALCAGGASAELRGYEADHGTIPFVAAADALAWSKDRLAGVAPTSGCASP